VTNVTREDSSAIQAAKAALQSAMDVYSLAYQMYRTMLHFRSGVRSSPLHRGPWNLAQASRSPFLHTNECAGLQRLQARSAWAISDASCMQRQQRDGPMQRCTEQAAEARAPHRAATHTNDPNCSSGNPCGTRRLLCLDPQQRIVLNLPCYLRPPQSGSGCWTALRAHRFGGGLAGPAVS